MSLIKLNQIIQISIQNGLLQIILTILLMSSFYYIIWTFHVLIQNTIHCKNNKPFIEYYTVY